MACPLKNECEYRKLVEPKLAEKMCNAGIPLFSKFYGTDVYCPHWEGKIEILKKKGYDLDSILN